VRVSILARESCSGFLCMACACSMSHAQEEEKKKEKKKKGGKGKDKEQGRPSSSCKGDRPGPTRICPNLPAEREKGRREEKGMSWSHSVRRPPPGGEGGEEEEGGKNKCGPGRALLLCILGDLLCPFSSLSGGRKGKKKGGEKHQSRLGTRAWGSRQRGLRGPCLIVSWGGGKKKRGKKKGKKIG